MPTISDTIMLLLETERIPLLMAKPDDKRSVDALQLARNVMLRITKPLLKTVRVPESIPVNTVLADHVNR